ncbi:CvpA family protein [bacterium]|nr:CvpA family protein [bacterium]MBU1636382.1 CvpA family protein [bacterium]
MFGLTIIDILIIFLLLGFGIAGIRRGMVMELLVTVGLGIALILTLVYRHSLHDLAERFTEPGWQQSWGTGLIFLLFFVTIYLSFAYIGNKLHTAIDKTVFKWPDRIFGLLAGALKGAVLIAMLVTVVQWADPSGNVRIFLSKSKLIRIGRTIGYDLTHWESAQQKKWI